MQTKLCLSAQELSDFDLGNMTDERHEYVSAHLDSCAECAARFEALDQQPDAVAESLRLELPPEILGEDSELTRLVTAAAALAETLAKGLAETRNEGGQRTKPTLEHIVGQILAPKQSADELGRLGGYRVLGVLGIGGMGIVFKAEDPALGRTVALKAMLPHLDVAGDSARERFLREARAMASIQHDNIVTIHQVAQAGKVPYLAMQLLDGESLASRLHDGQQVPIDEVCRIARETATGLAAAHAKGLTHRDIKPDNIWLESTGRDIHESHAPSPQEQSTAGRVKILDFGLAHVADDKINLTQSEAIVGTPSYLAPEQAQGKSVDARTDLFSLGVVMYVMLTGTSPFQRDGLLATLRAIDNETPPTPASLRDDVPPALSELVMRLLEKDPTRRGGSAADLVEAIRVIEVSPSGAVIQPQPRKAPPRRGVFIAAALAATALLILAGVIVTVRDKNGNVIAKISGKSVEIESVPDEADEGGDAGRPSKDPAAKEPVVGSKPVAGELAGEFLPPMTPISLVQRPAKLHAKDGEPVLSWTIATRPTIFPMRGIIPALRADGVLLATFGDDGCVRVFDVERRQLKKVLVGHSAGPAGGPTIRTNSRRFGPVVWQGNSPLLATASRDGSLRVWNVETGATVLQQEGMSGDINMVSWSPNGKYLVAAYANGGCIRCWQTDGWKELKSLDSLQGAPCGLAWSPDSTTLAMSTGEGAFLWQPANNQQRVMPEAPEVDRFGVGVAPVRWSPEGDQLAYRYRKTVTICDAKSLKPDVRIQLDDRPTAVPYDFSWSPDGRQMLVGWSDESKKEQHIHDVEKGEITTSFDDQTVNHLHFFDYLDWLPNGRTAMIGNKLFNTETKQVISGNFNLLWEASADGKIILSTDISNNPQISRLNVDVDKVEHTFTCPYIGSVSTYASPDSQSLSLFQDYREPFVMDWMESPLKGEHRALPISIGSWSPDGKYTLSADYVNGTGRICTWPDGKEKYFLKGIGAQTHAWSSDGSKLAVAGRWDLTLRVIDITSGKTLGPWKDPVGVKQYIDTIAWSRDGSKIVAGNRGLGTAAILSATDGSVIHSLEPGMGDSLLTWTPDDELVLCIGDKAVRVYEPQTGRLIRKITLNVPPSAIYGFWGLPTFHFINDHTLNLASSEGTLFEVDVKSGETKNLRQIPCDVAQLSAAGDYLFGNQGLVRRILRVADGQLIVSLVTAGAMVSPEGHIWTPQIPSGPLWSASPGIGATFVYVVETANGQETLTPVDFANRYGWQNDPSKVLLK